MKTYPPLLAVLLASSTSFAAPTAPVGQGVRKTSLSELAVSCAAIANRQALEAHTIRVPANVEPSRKPAIVMFLIVRDMWMANIGEDISVEQMAELNARVEGQSNAAIESEGGFCRTQALAAFQHATPAMQTTIRANAQASYSRTFKD